MTVLKKLQQLRVDLHSSALKKTGNNNGKPFFELHDFMPQAMVLMNTAGLCGVCSFTSELASLTLTDTDDGTSTVFTIPMGTAELKGAHVVQNIGACVTYERRYLWQTALDIMEHDGLDMLPLGDDVIQGLIEKMGAAETLADLKTAYDEALAAAGSNRDAVKDIGAMKESRAKAISAKTPRSEEMFDKAVKAYQSGTFTIAGLKEKPLTERQQKIVADLEAAQQ
jgi:hypothetical protein